MGYSADVRERAVKMYVDGANFRRRGRYMQVNHQSMVNWVNAATEKLKPEDAPVRRTGNGRWWSWMNSSRSWGEKNEVYVVTQVHRETRCFMSWQVVTTRTAATMQPIIDDAPAAFQYCTDGFSTYETLNYHQGLHLVADGKSQTYSVEGGNADLSDYLTRGAK